MAYSKRLSRQPQVQLAASSLVGQWGSFVAMENRFSGGRASANVAPRPTSALKRICYLLFIVMLPLGVRGGAAATVSGDDVEVTSCDDVPASDLFALSVPLLTEDYDLREPREETEEEEEEESDDKVVMTNFGLPIVDCLTDWNTVIFLPCSPPLRKRYILFQALKLDC